LTQQQEVIEKLFRAPTPVVAEAIEELQNGSGPAKAIKTRLFVKHLVEQRREPLTTELCNLILASHSDPSGSADEVRNLMRRMGDKNLRRTPVTFRNVLWVRGPTRLSTNAPY
jgi:hypothetical protein